VNIEAFAKGFRQGPRRSHNFALSGTQNLRKEPSLSESDKFSGRKCVLGRFPLRGATELIPGETIMVKLTNTIVVRQVARLNAAIITIRGTSFGSLNEAKLAQLRVDLAGVKELMPTSHQRIIVDLSSISIMGTGFLRELFAWIGALGRSAEDIILCGDQTGLLKLCATDRWLTVQSDLSAAIDYSRRGQFVGN